MKMSITFTIARGPSKYTALQLICLESVHLDNYKKRKAEVVI